MLRTKIRLFNTNGESILLYGSECGKIKSEFRTSKRDPNIYSQVSQNNPIDKIDGQSFKCRNQETVLSGKHHGGNNAQKVAIQWTHSPKGQYIHQQDRALLNARSQATKRMPQGYMAQNIRGVGPSRHVLGSCREKGAGSTVLENSCRGHMCPMRMIVMRLAQLVRSLTTNQKVLRSFPGLVES